MSRLREWVIALFFIWCLATFQRINAELKANHWTENAELIDEIHMQVEDEYYSRRKRAIFPGTLWCGEGDKAGGDYKKLGKFRILDRCCREHDYCPLKIHKDKRRWGVINLMGYTISACDCDETFYTCLKTVKTKGGGWFERHAANICGRIYFNLIKLPCVLLPSGLNTHEKEVDMKAPHIYSDGPAAQLKKNPSF